jgi:hypothetical protein
MIRMYGIACGTDNIHYDVSHTERGAKNYATRNGYTKVTKRNGYNALIISEKKNGKWVSRYE